MTTYFVLTDLTSVFWTPSYIVLLIIGWNAVVGSIKCIDLNYVHMLDNPNTPEYKLLATDLQNQVRILNLNYFFENQPFEWVVSHIRLDSIKVTS